MLPSSHHDFRLTSVLLIVILADPVGAATAGLGFIAAKLEFNAVALTESKSLMPPSTITRLILCP